MHKRGQVFILAALILSFIIFSLAVKVNIANRPIIEGDFEGLSRNYDIESTKFINLLTEKNFREALKLEDVAVLFLNFTQDFTSYSKTQNPEFGVIYFFDFESSISGQGVGKLFVGNYLDQDIIVWTKEGEEQVVEGCKNTVNAGVSFGEFKFNTGVETLNFDCATNLSRGNSDPYSFSFIIGDIEYTSEISLGEAKIGIVAHEDTNEQRRVYINELKEGSVVDPITKCDELAGKGKIPGNFFICNCEKRNKKNCEDFQGDCVYCEESKKCLAKNSYKAECFYGEP